MAVDTPSPEAASSALAWVALAVPILGAVGACLFFGNPFTLPASDWGKWFMIALVLGGSGVMGLIMACIALSQSTGLAGVALVVNGLAVLAALGILFG